MRKIFLNVPNHVKCDRCGQSIAQTGATLYQPKKELSYFCDMKCLQLSLEKAEEDAKSTFSKREDDIETIRLSLITIADTWIDQKSDEPYFAYICGMLADGAECFVVTKVITFYRIAKCRDLEKLRNALAFANVISKSK